MESKLTLSISGHERSILCIRMSVNDTYRTFSVKYVLNHFHKIVFCCFKRIKKHLKSNHFHTKMAVSSLLMST